MELKSPVSKRSRNTKRHPALPILLDESSYPFLSDDLKIVFNGYFNGVSVVVDDEDEMKALYNMGFFGKGSLSRSFPCFGKRKKGIPPVLKERQWKRRKEWKDKLGSMLEKLPKSYEDEKTVSSANMDQPLVENPNAENGSDEKKSNPEADQKIFDATLGDESKMTENQNVNSEMDAISVSENNKESESSIVTSTDVGDSSVDSKSKEVEKDDGKITPSMVTSEPLDIDSKEVADNEKTEEKGLTIANDNKSEKQFEEITNKSENISVIPDESTSSVGEINLTLTSEKEPLKSNDKESEILVLADSDDEMDDYMNNLNAHIENDNLNVIVEMLHLTLEEAFFLSFGLGCLNIVDLSGKQLDLREMWQLFSTSQDDFIESYICYHYFRAKGWVVKSGLKFGGNFLLYKEGPPFYHASYIVIIENINKKFNNENDKKQFTWDNLMALYRMGETSKKEILICQILWPDDLEKISCPTVLKNFKVSESLLRRWLPCQEKEDD